MARLTKLLQKETILFSGLRFQETCNPDSNPRGSVHPKFLPPSLIIRNRVFELLYSINYNQNHEEKYF